MVHADGSVKGVAHNDKGPSLFFFGKEVFARVEKVRRRNHFGHAGGLMGKAHHGGPLDTFPRRCVNVDVLGVVNRYQPQLRVGGVPFSNTHLTRLNLVQTESHDFLDGLTSAARNVKEKGCGGFG